MVSIPARDIVSFGRVTTARWWLGVAREDDARLYQAMSWWQRMLFWRGVVQALRVIYPRVDTYAAMVIVVSTICLATWGLR